MLHICHISVLNPALHTRIFYKIACSQVKMGYQVSILAQDEHGSTYEKHGVQIHPVKPFGRLSLRRILFNFLIWRKAKKLKADVYILHAPELLFLGKRLKKAIGAKIVYDVHENYLVNIREAEHYPLWMRERMGPWVRKQELSAVKWLDAVSYAEEVYLNMLEVPADRWFLLRNTFASNAIESRPDTFIPVQPYMLYTGLIATERGIWESLALWKSIHTLKQVKLIVAGHCQLPGLIGEVLDWVEKNGLTDDFVLVGGYDYVPYANMLKLIEHCWCGLMLYHPLPQILGKIPTKIYEFMAFNKPLIYTETYAWAKFYEMHGLGIGFNEYTDPEHILQRLGRISQIKERPHPSSYSWEKDEEELARMMKLIEEKQSDNP